MCRTAAQFRAHVVAFALKRSRRRAAAPAEPAAPAASPGGYSLEVHRLATPVVLSPEDAERAFAPRTIELD